MSDNKNRFKALISDEKKPANKFASKKNSRNNENNRWKIDDKNKTNVFQSRRNNNRRGGGGRGRGRRYFGRNRVTPMNKDSNFKPDIIGHGEVSFMPQKKVQKQQKRKISKVEPLVKKEEDTKMTEDDLAITLAMAQKYQYFTESEEEEEEEEYEHDPLLPDTDIV